MKSPKSPKPKKQLPKQPVTRASVTPVSEYQGPVLSPEYLAEQAAAEAYRDVKFAINDEVKRFAVQLLKTYGVVNDRDYRREISWCFEQVGLTMHSDVEREKRAKLVSQQK